MTSLTLELGARRVWCRYTEGKFVESGRTRDNKPTFKFQPAKYDNVLVPDEVAEGLKVESDSWKEANAAARHPAGELNRLIRVSNIKRIGPDETTEPPLMRGLNKTIDRLVDRLEHLLTNSKK